MHNIFHIISTILIGLTVLMVSGCSDQLNELNEGRSMPLVIEGWIENGEKPVVMVTRAVDLTQTTDTLEKYIEKWCRVSIYDGENTYYLSGKMDKAYTPAFIYTTSRLHGVAGKTYHLKVELEDEIVEADTRIPSPVAVDSLRIMKNPQCDTLYQVMAFPHIAPGTSDCYKFFTRVRNEEKRFFSSFLGTFEGYTYDPNSGFSVSRGIHNTYNGEQKFSPYYAKGDTVEIRFCHINEDAFRFWQSYETCVSMSGSILFNTLKECKGNIDHAIGYWFGYGLTRTSIIIE